MLCHKSWNASGWLLYYKESCINVMRVLFYGMRRTANYLASHIDRFTLGNVKSVVLNLRGVFHLLEENVWQFRFKRKKISLYKSGTMGIVRKRKSLTHRSTQIPSGKIPLRKSKKVCSVHGPRLFSFSKNNP